MARAIATLAPAVADRSGGRCEAVWHPGYRCPNRADALHHRLPRAQARRGDEHLLDLAQDADNIAHLCRPCHDAAHANPDRARAACLSGAFGSTHPDEIRAGIIVPGTITAADADLVYVGDHPTYRLRYPGGPDALA